MKYILYLYIPNFQCIMKQKGSISDMCEYRDKVIVQMYWSVRKQLFKAGAVSNMHICHIIARMPVKRYFISYDAARAVLYKKERKDFFSYRYVLLCCFRKKYNEYKKRFPLVGKSELLTKVLETPAPCIGVSPSRIRAILIKQGIK